MADLTINTATSDADVQAVKSIFLEYLNFIEAALGQPLDFQGTEKEFATFPMVYNFLTLAKLGGEPVAACGVKHFKSGICELKRLYALPNGRGHRLGERLTLAAMETAKSKGYATMYLDTDPSLSHAIKIYQKLGFSPIERYYDNPMGCSIYMKKSL